jgi:hypothetical protein
MTLSERHLHRLVWAAVQAALMRSPVYRKKPSAAAHEARVQADAAVIESRIGERRK